ncbi:MAG: DNA gyrase inhibitor YacG [Gammaproteobacteria bacterium]|nr:MAG: DNA gyrase inhibitor YacG [Gammaproteobacteria bacterium]
MTKVNCPVCQTIVEWDENSEYRPFCSERCKMIDLGDWISENHRIPGEPAEIADESISEEQRNLLN